MATPRSKRELSVNVVEGYAATSSTRPTDGSTVTLRAGGDRWRDNAELLFRYLSREMEDAEQQRLERYPDTGADHILRPIALIWRLARELSTLYLRPPSRTWDGADELAVERIEDVYRKARFDRRCRTAQEHVSAIGNATMWCWLTSDGFRWLVPPVHEQWVTPARIDACEVEDVAAWRVRFPVVADPYATSVPTATALITPDVAVWETGPEGWAGKGIWAADGSNPFRRIPVIMLRATDPMPGEWWAPVPEDLLNAQRALNHDFTDLGEFARKQGFAQAVAKGLQPSAAATIDTGPEKVVGVPADGDFSFASPSPDLAGCLAQLRGYLEAVIGTSGMNPATVMKSNGITALAKIVEVMDREVERIRHKDEFALGEQRAYELMAIATALRPGGEGVMPPGVRVSVEYREPVMPADPTSAAQAGAQLIAQNRETAATLLAYERGISLDEAEARVRANAAFTASLSAAAQSPDRPTTPTHDVLPADGHLDPQAVTP